MYLIVRFCHAEAQILMNQLDDKRLFVDTVGTGLFESVYRIDKEKFQCSYTHRTTDCFDDRLLLRRQIKVNFAGKG